MKTFVKITFFSFLLCVTRVVFGLDVELTRGIESAVPVAMVPFAGEVETGFGITSFIHTDLSNSGRFALLDEPVMTQRPHQPKDVDQLFWRKQNIEHVIVGSVKAISEELYQVSFAVVDLYQGSGEGQATKDHIALEQTLQVNRSQMRHLSHHISDLIYQQLTGERGIFSTRLAYVLVNRRFSSIGEDLTQYSLQISDMDGFNSKPILQSSEPIMSPSWSPDGKKIAYVSFEGKRPAIYVSDIASGERQLITRYPGINGAPAWSPDGKKLAVALSSNTNPNIYLIDLESKKLTQLSRGYAINTEPSWAPDGKSIIFTSDRGGAPQIYQMDLKGKHSKRLTYVGNYNAKASLTPDGKTLVMLHREAKSFNIAALDLEQGLLRELTSFGFNESPSVAPNGRMVVFASQDGGHGVLGMASIDGQVTLRIPDRQGNVQEPVWSPFLH